MDLNHGSTGYEPVGISGRPAPPAAFLTTLPRCGGGHGGFRIRGWRVERRSSPPPGPRETPADVGGSDRCDSIGSVGSLVLLSAHRRAEVDVLTAVGPVGRSAVRIDAHPTDRVAHLSHDPLVHPEGGSVLGTFGRVPGPRRLRSSAGARPTGRSRLGPDVLVGPLSPALSSRGLAAASWASRGCAKYDGRRLDRASASPARCAVRHARFR